MAVATADRMRGDSSCAETALSLRSRPSAHRSSGGCKNCLVAPGTAGPSSSEFTVSVISNASCTWGNTPVRCKSGEALGNLMILRPSGRHWRGNMELAQKGGAKQQLLEVLTGALLFDSRSIARTVRFSSKNDQRRDSRAPLGLKGYASRRPIGRGARVRCRCSA